MKCKRNDSNKNIILANKGYLVALKFRHSFCAARKNGRFNIPKIKGIIK